MVVKSIRSLKGSYSPANFVRPLQGRLTYQSCPGVSLALLVIPQAIIFVAFSDMNSLSVLSFKHHRTMEKTQKQSHYKSYALTQQISGSEPWIIFHESPSSTEPNSLPFFVPKYTSLPTEPIESRKITS